MNSAYLLTGGNLGDRKKNLETALDLIRVSCGMITKISSVYETAAWGKIRQPDFLNQVLELQTILSPQELISAIVRWSDESIKGESRFNGQRT